MARLSGSYQRYRSLLQAAERIVSIMERKTIALVWESSSDVAARIAAIGLIGAFAFVLAFIGYTAATWLRGALPHG